MKEGVVTEHVAVLTSSEVFAGSSLSDDYLGRHKLAFLAIFFAILTSNDPSGKMSLLLLLAIGAMTYCETECT